MELNDIEESKDNIFDDLSCDSESSESDLDDDLLKYFIVVSFN